MIGYLKNNRYENAYGTPIACFKCGENKCNGSKSFSLRFGGNGELIHCESHEHDAKIEAEKRNAKTSDFNMKISNT